MQSMCPIKTSCFSGCLTKGSMYPFPSLTLNMIEGVNERVDKLRGLLLKGSSCKLN